MKDVRGGEAMHNKWRWKNLQGRSQFGLKGTIEQPVAADTWGQIGSLVYVQRSERTKMIVVSDNSQPYRRYQRFTASPVAQIVFTSIIFDKMSATHLVEDHVGV